MFKVFAYYLMVVVTLCFPPAIIFTGVPLVYFGLRAIAGIRQARLLGDLLAEQQVRREEYQAAQRVRKLLS